MATEKTSAKKSLYQKLLEIQKQINGLGKDKAAFGYKYVTGDKVLEHLKPLMNDLGLILKQEVLSIDNTRQDYKTKNGETSEINSKVMMRFTWVDTETGDKDENLFGANGQNAWDKGVGSALTYGERYFLLKYFHIATDEDDIDNPERKPVAVPAKTEPVQQTQPEPASDELKAVLLKTLEGFKGLYSETDYARGKTTINSLIAEKAEAFKKQLQTGILNRLKKERVHLNHQASTEQLDLIDKNLLSRVFTIDEKAGYNTANFEYDASDASERIEFLLKALKDRKQATTA